MLAIPLPFVAALLLLMTGIVLRYRHTSQKPFWFVILCALMVTVVGLRWTFDIPLFRFLQPILSASVPVAAWLCFAGAHRSQSSTHLHWLGPIVVLVGSLFYEYVWAGTLDVLLILLYLGYGSLLLKSSLRMPEQVRLTDVPKVLVAERVAGAMLLFSALVDSALSYDILLLNAQHTNLILSISYLVLIPAVVFAVMVVSISTPAEVNNKHAQTSPSMSQRFSEEVDTLITSVSRIGDDQAEETAQIMAKFDALMRDHQVFKDPDLSLNRLARKLGIPARKISSAVNQTYQQNISKVINAYRIEHAKTLLRQTDDAITEIFLNSGFQTKSNFNREFSRITGQTPSEFRSSPQVLE